MSFCISFGFYGGFYLDWGWTKRICFGWVAVTYFPEDLDVILERLNRLTDNPEFPTEPSTSEVSSGVSDLQESESV